MRARFVAWLRGIVARVFGQAPPTSTQAMACLHPSFNPCNRYGYATCTVCKAKLPC